MPSPVLDGVYAEQKDPLPSTPEPTPGADGEPLNPPDPSRVAGTENPNGETMLLSQANGKKLTQALNLPQLEAELERAIWQVETAMKRRVDSDAAAAAAAVAAAAKDSGQRGKDEKSQ